jgi:hypothetical protein
MELVHGARSGARRPCIIQEGPYGLMGSSNAVHAKKVQLGLNIIYIFRTQKNVDSNRVLPFFALCECENGL